MKPRALYFLAGAFNPFDYLSEGNLILPPPSSPSFPPPSVPGAAAAMHGHPVMLVPPMHMWLF